MTISAFNRTTVECKSDIKGNRLIAFQPFNRTTVECKCIQKG